MHRFRLSLLVLACAALGVWLLKDTLLVGPSAPTDAGGIEDDVAVADLDGEAIASDRPGLVGEERGRARRSRRSATHTHARARRALAGSTGPHMVPFVGVVRGPGGRKLVGVRVIAHGEHDTVKFHTDAGGAFYQRLVTGRHDLLFLGPDGALLLHQVLIDRAGPGSYEFVLREPGTIKAIVRRGNDLAAGVQLQVKPEGIFPFQSTLHAMGVTDGEGVVHFESLPAGRYELVGTTPEGALISVPGVEVSPGEERQAIIRLPETVRLTGTVREQSTGAVVADAVVLLEVQPEGSEAIFEVAMVTGPDGKFVLDVPRGMPRGFSVEAAGFAPCPSAESEDVQRVLYALRGLAGDKPVQYDVPLHRGTTLKGIVENQHGRPVPGVMLAVYPERGLGDRQIVTSDEGGRFELAHLGRGTYVVDIRTPGLYHVDTGQPRFRIVDGSETVAFTVQVRATRRVTGRVTSAGGKGVAGARVWILGEGLEAFARGLGHVVERYESQDGWVLLVSLGEVYTEPDGSFLLVDVPTNHDVEFFLRAAKGQAVAAPVALDEPTQDDERRGASPPYRLVLAPGGEIHGVVVDSETRRVVAGAVVRVEPGERDTGRATQTLRSGGAGTFQARGLPQGAWRVIVEAEGFLRFAGDMVETGDKPVKAYFDLDAGVVFAGTVRDKDGTPLAGVRLSVMTPPDDGVAPTWTTRTDASGHFRLSGIDHDREYVLVAARDGYRTLEVARLQVSQTDMKLTLKSLRRPRRTPAK